MKKSNVVFWGILTVILVIGLVLTGCGDNGDPGSPNNPNNPNNNGGTETGLYMGIIGFNENVSPKEISLLSNNNKSQFQTFISSLAIKDGTGLYYAVDTAINKLQAATLPNDLANVSIVTFTDGLDNVSIDLNTNYKTRDEYRDAVNNRIKSTTIKGMNITAYSVGVKGGDVLNETAFDAGLAALASSPSNAKKVTSMAEVNRQFQVIADSLYQENQSQSLKLKMTAGYESGTKIRFTFDNATDAANSSMYIEGTYDRETNPRTLKNVVYYGLKSTSGVTVKGELSGVFIYWTFENVSTVSGGTVTVSVTSTHQWEFLESSSQWQRNIEFGKTGDVEVVVEEKSAVIMLVLDCTSSLDAEVNGIPQNGSAQMKTAAKDFIDILTGNSNSGGNTAVTLNSVTANGSSSQTTTQLTLNFSQAITGLSASDITLSGVSGISKGTLSGSGPSYTLPVTGFSSGGTLSVAVSKSGYDISGSPKTVSVYYYNSGGGTGQTVTLTSNNPYGWQAVYTGSSLFSGKITQGDQYTLTYSFKSNVAMDYFQVVFIDNSAQGSSYKWVELSDYKKVKENITANTVYSGTVTIIATGTATDATAQANRLVLQAGPGTSSSPTLTFTALSIVKTGGGGPIVWDMDVEQWYEKTLSAGEKHYYRFYAQSGAGYWVAWEDSDSLNSNASKYTDVVVGIKREGSSTYIVEPTDGGNDPVTGSNDLTFQANFSGYVLIEVQGYTPSTSGSYGILYGTW